MKIRSIILTALGLGLATVPAHAQSPRPLATPNLDLWRAGRVEVMVPTADGGMLVGGSFTLVQGIARTGIAKLKADGTLDLGWDPQLAGQSPSVRAIAVDSSGAVYLGGLFESVDGFGRDGLAKLDASGELDPLWNPDFTGFSSMRDLKVVGAHLYVARFLAGGGDDALLRIPTGGMGDVDPSWAPLLSQAEHLASDASGFLYVSDARMTGDAQPLIRIAVAGNGAIDPDWQPTVGGRVNAMVFDGAGNMIIGGDFSSVQGSPRSDLAKLSLATGAAMVPAWSASVDGRVNALLVVDGSLHVGGYFASAGGQAHRTLARFALSGNGAVDSGWTHEARGSFVTSLALNAAGQVLIGGGFAQVDSASRSGLAVIDPSTGVLADSPAFEGRGHVSAMAARGNGSLVIGGNFSRIGATPRHNFAVIDASGNLDPAWRADALGLPLPYVMAPDPFTPGFESESFVASLLVDASGRVYLGGSFDQVNGVARSNLARLLDDGDIDTGWNPGSDGSIQAFHLSGSNQLFVGGNFSRINNLPRLNVAKLSTAAGATVDPTWAPEIELGGEVDALLLDGNGSLYVGGAFPRINGEACCNGIARLSATGTGARDPSFDVRLAGLSAPLQSLALDDSGRLYLSGRFDSIVQSNVFHMRHGIARVGSNGLVDAWQPLPSGTFALYRDFVLHGSRVYVAEAGHLNRVLAIESGAVANPVIGWDVRANGGSFSLLRRGETLFVGGGFTQIAATPRVGLAAFSLDGIFRNGFDD